MENDVDISYNIKTWIIVGVVALITFILVFVVTNKLVNGNKKKTNTTNTTPEKVEKYTKYDEGDSVTLSDGSKWHVLYETLEDNEYITLLSDEDVSDGATLYGNLNSYLKGTYKTNLTTKLGIESSDIYGIRLLAYLDLANITKYNSSEFLPETPLSEFKVPEFISATETVTDTVYTTDEANNPVMICTKDTKSYVPVVKTETNTDDATEAKEETPVTSDSTLGVARFCLGDSTKALPVRPVVVLSKKIVKSDSTTEKEETNTKEEEKKEESK